MVTREAHRQELTRNGPVRFGVIGGGVMLNQAPHAMDMFIRLCGMPCEVFGRTETRTHKAKVMSSKVETSRVWRKD